MVNIRSLEAQFFKLRDQRKQVCDELCRTSGTDSQRIDDLKRQKREFGLKITEVHNKLQAEHYYPWSQTYIW